MKIRHYQTHYDYEFTVHALTFNECLIHYEHKEQPDLINLCKVLVHSVTLM